MTILDWKMIFLGESMLGKYCGSSIQPRIDDTPDAQLGGI